MLKNLLIIVFILILTNSCMAMSKRSTPKIANDQKVFLFNCDSFDDAFKNKDFLVCSTRCTDRARNGFCRAWDIDVRDLRDRETYMFFKNNGSLIAPKERVFSKMPL